MLTMKNVMRKNHQETEDVPGSQSGAECHFGDFVGEMMPSAKPRSYQASIDIAVASPNCFMSPGMPPLVMMGCRALKSSAEASLYQGAIDIATESPNCSRSPGVTPPVMIDCNILMGLSKRSLPVRMIVIAMETFFLPCMVRLPKVIFRKRTLLRIPVSARLFVGSIAGYLRKTKSSFLWVISRLRMLSASWCDNGECWYSVLNLFRIAFLPERYSSAERMEY